MELKSLFLLTVHLQLVVLASFVSGLPKEEEGMIQLPPATPMEIMNALDLDNLDVIRQVLRQDKDTSSAQHQDPTDEDLLRTVLHPMAVLKLENLVQSIREAANKPDEGGDGEEGTSRSTAMVGSISSHMMHPAILSHSNNDYDNKE